jgi:hypothetical protein
VVCRQRKQQRGASCITAFIMKSEKKIYALAPYSFTHTTSFLRYGSVRPSWKGPQERLMKASTFC